MSTTTPGHNAVTDYVHSWSGVTIQAGRGGIGAPTLLDIAVQTGRQPRFAGATDVWWPVLMHHLAGARLVRHDPRLRLLWLLHDAHEGITGDVPSPLKPVDLCLLQADLDVRIRESLGVPPPTAEEDAELRRLDRRMLYAEGAVVGPPGKEWIPDDAPDDEARRAVTAYRDRYLGREAETIRPDGTAVTEYVGMVQRLIEETT